MWTISRLAAKFAEELKFYSKKLRNGSLTFTVHFRNSAPQKIEVESKEHFGKNPNNQ